MLDTPLTLIFSSPGCRRFHADIFADAIIFAAYAIRRDAAITPRRYVAGAAAADTISR
jgi:hypothetical protein